MKHYLNKWKNRLSRLGQEAQQEDGMATVEYAIGTLAAAAFAGLLLAIIKGGSLSSILEGLITSALSVG